MEDISHSIEEFKKHASTFHQQTVFNADMKQITFSFTDYLKWLEVQKLDYIVSWLGDIQQSIGAIAAKK